MEMETEPRFVVVAGALAIPPEGSLEFDVDGRSLLLCRSKGAFFAVANLCSHADQALAGGRVRGGWIACPAHGARFDLATGRALNPPATRPIETFPVRVMDGKVEVAVDAR